jgi:alkylated DNA repair dioxygenase AlkB
LLPAGVTYVNDFISPEEEHALAVHLDLAEWNAELKRRVQHFGYRYDYKARKVSDSDYLGALPDWLAFLTSRLVATGCFDSLPDQIIANEYMPGQGISAHIDCIPCFDDTIVSVSLLSQCEMVFRQQQSGAILSAMLHPRSAIVLKGAGRYDWTHEIPARKSDMVNGVKMARERRISLTFRKIIGGIER